MLGSPEQTCVWHALAVHDSAVHQHCTCHHGMQAQHQADLFIAGKLGGVQLTMTVLMPASCCRICNPSPAGHTALFVQTSQLLQVCTSTQNRRKCSSNMYHIEMGTMQPAEHLLVYKNHWGLE